MTNNKVTNIIKAPLKNGVFVCTEPKNRTTEFKDLLKVELINPESVGLSKGATYGDYFIKLEEKIEELEEQLNDLSNRFDSLLELVEVINERSL